MRSLGFLGLTAALLATTALPAAAESAVTPERLVNPEPENWLNAHRTYDHWRWSPLTIINADNVGDLKVAYAVALAPSPPDVGPVETVPMVDDGFLYVTTQSNILTKFNVQSGTSALPVWSFDPEVRVLPFQIQITVNRGVGLAGDAAILNTPDGRVISVDRASGQALWEVQLGEDPSEGFTTQPLIVNDLALIGQSRGDWGTRGWVSAVDLADGSERWRFWAIPGPGEAGHETWLNDAWQTGGGSIWTQPSYDPDSNTVFVGVGNAAPAFDPEYRPGDNLYTSSVVALDADTGAVQWYHQFVANEGFEWDEITPYFVVNTQINGESRQVLAHHSTRNGHFYVLDRSTGEHVFGVANAPSINWTEGFDPKTGLPVEYDPDAQIQTYGGINATRDGSSLPLCQAATQWGGQTYSPEHNRVYTLVNDSCSTRATQAPNYEEQPYVYGNVVDGQLLGYRLQSGQGDPVPDEMLMTRVGPRLTAVDVSTGETVAAVPVAAPTANGGTMGTAAGLIFAGFNDGAFRAYDADTLATLWEVNVGTQFHAPPITFATGGNQYVAIAGGASGGDTILWVFGL
ncbi:MAG: PQQ-binding-like beta-propeller repeat protein [Bauldia sp.]|nr:PQQ-binding-like beta-propeller repeat protein [Bauldia sp.]